MRLTIDKIPSDVTAEELITEINKRFDVINKMMTEIDEDNLSQSILDRMRGDI